MKSLFNLSSKIIDNIATKHTKYSNKSFYDFTIPFLMSTYNFIPVYNLAPASIGSSSPCDVENENLMFFVGGNGTVKRINDPGMEPRVFDADRETS